MTDLKPDNTLYDTTARKATIIDLGGAVKIEKEIEIKEFNLSRYSFQSTEKYAGELKGKNGIIDISKALAYAIGQIILEVTQKTDYPKKGEIIELAKSLTEVDVVKRSSIKEAINKINAMGDDYHASVIFSNYIAKIKGAL
jgi:hypothetical protein